ncbi:hypothetical protein [Bradyrhizobium sp. USDA 3315]
MKRFERWCRPRLLDVFISRGRQTADLLEETFDAGKVDAQGAEQPAAGWDDPLSGQCHIAVCELLEVRGISSPIRRREPTLALLMMCELM